MIHSLGELKKIAHARAKAREIVRDEEGRAVIPMTVRDDTDFLSPFSFSGKETVSDGVADFLERGALPFRHKESLTVRIYSDCIDDEEKKVYAEAIREHFFGQHLQNARRLKRNAVSAVLLFLCGAVLLGLMAILMTYSVSDILVEIVDIFAWVFIWEAVDIFCLERELLRMKQERYLRFMNCKVEYFPLAH